MPTAVGTPVDITRAPMDRQETLSRLAGSAEKGIRISLKIRKPALAAVAKRAIRCCNRSERTGTLGR